MQTIICYAAALTPLGIVRDATNSAGACAPALTAGSPILLKLRLFADLNSGEALPLATFADITGWSFELDNDYDQQTPCKIVADNGNITVGSVVEDGKTFTEVDIPITNTYTEEVAAALGTSPKINLNGELVGYKDGSASYVLQLRGFTVLNRISGLTEPTPIPPADYEQIASRAASGAIVESGLVDSRTARTIASGAAVEAVAPLSGGLQQQIDQRPTSSGAQQIADSKANTAVNAHNVSDTAHAGLFAKVIQTRDEMPDPNAYLNGPLVCYTGETIELEYTNGHIYRAVYVDDPEGEGTIPAWVDLTPGLPEGVMFENRPFSTTVGGYTVALTSGGGLLVSGSGASIALSGGQITAIGSENMKFVYANSDFGTSAGVVVEHGGAKLFYDGAYAAKLEASQQGFVLSGGSGEVISGYEGVVTVNSRPVATQLVTSTDAETPSAAISILSGGMSYKYTLPLYSLIVDSVVKTTEASYIHFTLDSVTAPTPVVISGVSYLNSATFEGGKEYLVGFFDGMAVVNEVTQ